MAQVAHPTELVPLLHQVAQVAAVVVITQQPIVMVMEHQVKATEEALGMVPAGIFRVQVAVAVVRVQLAVQQAIT